MLIKLQVNSQMERNLFDDNLLLAIFCHMKSFSSIITQYKTTLIAKHSLARVDLSIILILAV